MFGIPEWDMVVVRLGLDGSDGEITANTRDQFLKEMGDQLTLNKFESI